MRHLIAVALVITACSDSKSTRETKSKTDQTPKRLRELATKLCKCETTGCGRRANKAMQDLMPPLERPRDLHRELSAKTAPCWKRLARADTKRMESFAKRICACRKAKCAERLAGEMMAWCKAGCSGGGTGALQARFTAADKRAVACWKKLASSKVDAKDVFKLPAKR